MKRLLFYVTEANGFVEIANDSRKRVLDTTYFLISAMYKIIYIEMK